MALFVRIEQLAARRQTLGPLVDRYTQGDPAFADAAIEWLRETEEVMGRLRLPTGARLSTLRAAIVRAGDEVGPRPEGGRSRADAWRARAAAAATSLEAAEQVMHDESRAAQERLQHFEDKLIEALTAGVLVDLVPPRPREGGPPWNEWLTGIWARLAGHRAMRPTAIYLAAALTAADRLYLLDRVLVRLTARELPVLDVAASDGAPPSEAVSSDN